MIDVEKHMWGNECCGEERSFVASVKPNFEWAVFLQKDQREISNGNRK